MFLSVQYVDSEFYTIIFARASNAIVLFQSGNYMADLSTAVRVIEIKNIIYTLVNALPFSGPFGMGSGALWFENVQRISGGLHAENFRANGGLHHIFTASIAMLFRYGVVGVVIILLWLGGVIRKLNNSLKDISGDPFKYSICLAVLLYIFYALLSDTFVPVYVYGNIKFGFLLAMGYVVARSQYNIKERKNIENSHC